MNDATQSILRVTDLKVNRGGREILDLPDFAVSRGEVLSLIGPNGAGKTTLLQTLACLFRPSAGDVLFKGQRITKETALAYRRRIAMVFQEPLLFRATVRDNVAASLKFRGMKRTQMADRVQHQLERFGIAHLRDRAAWTLSGGEAQRTSLARAFATEPEILFLDEPFAALDLPTKETLLDDVEKILRTTGTTAVLATHDRIEALRLSDRIGVMAGGRMVQLATSDEIMNHPADEFVAAFVGMETVLTGQVTETAHGIIRIAVAGQTIEAVGEAKAGERVMLFVHPDQVTLSPCSVQTSARNQYQGKIEKIITNGYYNKVRIDCGFELTAFITRTSLEELALREQMNICASFKATAIHVIRKG